MLPLGGQITTTEEVQFSEVESVSWRYNTNSRLQNISLPVPSLRFQIIIIDVLGPESCLVREDTSVVLVCVLYLKSYVKLISYRMLGEGGIN